MMPRAEGRRSQSTDVIRMVLDDDTVERLRVAAEARGIDVEQLLVQLLVASSTEVDRLLGPPNRD